MNMRVHEFQALMRELYFDKDNKRGAERTLLWLMEEVGELSEAMRKKDRAALEEELADIMAWTTSLANILGIDMEEALMEKYPGYCRYCGESPCTCEKNDSL
jgi:NTP pyrophosphatase (non-canonical NTP hydrolase)